MKTAATLWPFVHVSRGSSCLAGGFRPGGPEPLVLLSRGGRCDVLLLNAEGDTEGRDDGRGVDSSLP